jgi:hypothetical protein
MTDFGIDRSASFEARLSNWKPAGEIHVKGAFSGPSNAKDPRWRWAPTTRSTMPTSHDQGIGGILSSKGRFHGALERTRVEAPPTRRRDFRVDVAGQPVHPQTRFAAVVDAQRQHLARAGRGDPGRTGRNRPAG